MWTGVSEPDPKSEEATICTPETEQLSLLLERSSPNSRIWDELHPELVR